MISAYLSVESIPKRALPATGRFDVLGSITLAVALIGIILAISKIVLDDWPRLLVYGVLLTSSLLLVFWGFYEKRINSPVVNIAEFVGVFLGFRLVHEGGAFGIRGQDNIN